MSSGSGGWCGSQRRRRRRSASTATSITIPPKAPGRKMPAGSNRSLTRRDQRGQRPAVGRRPGLVDAAGAVERPCRPGGQRGPGRGHPRGQVRAGGEGEPGQPQPGPGHHGRAVRPARRRSRAGRSVERPETFSTTPSGLRWPVPLRLPQRLVVVHDRTRRPERRRSTGPSRVGLRAGRHATEADQQRRRRRRATRRPGSAPPAARRASASAPRPSASGRRWRRPDGGRVRPGSGCSRTATDAIRPSVPYEPVNSLPRSYPATFLMTLPPARGDRAVGEHHGDADDEVAQAAVAVPGRAGVGRGDQAADGAARVGRVDGQPLPGARRTPPGPPPAAPRPAAPR